jgi:hypothetical protein
MLCKIWKDIMLVYVTLFTCVLLHIKLYLHVYCYTSNCIYMCTVTHQIVFHWAGLELTMLVVIGIDKAKYHTITTNHDGQQNNDINRYNLMCSITHVNISCYLNALYTCQDYRTHNPFMFDEVSIRTILLGCCDNRDGMSYLCNTIYMCTVILVYGV